MSQPAFVERTDGRPGKSGGHSDRVGAGRRWLLGSVVLLALGGAGIAWWRHEAAPSGPPPARPLPLVTVAAPLAETVADEAGFLGQFSAVDSVELRAQVGGTLTEIGFRDGQMVAAGDLLFVIDPRPYQVRLDQAAALYQTAAARSTLAQAELWRAQQLRRTDFGTGQSVDQRTADQHASEAAIAQAKAAIVDAQLDLGYARVTAPFAGRIGARRVSVGSLVSGSRAGTSATTLLATLVSLDPIYLDFDMTEDHYKSYVGNRADAVVRPDGAVTISLDGGAQYTRQGRLDFIDNAIDRRSGTIHARATVANPGGVLTPGEFARLRLVVEQPRPVLLIPAASVVLDQSDELVMTVGADGTVISKKVTTGALHDGLRIVRGGLELTDRVVVDGLVRAQPGGKVAPVPGTIKPDPNG